MGGSTHLAQRMLGDAVDIFQCCILTWDFLPVVLPAYLLAGAIAAFVPISKILRYLGYQARRSVAYAVAVVSGTVVSLCSCNIVPLVLSIYERGAGIGPAFALLYAGPTLNLVALVWTFQVFGGVFGLWRLGGTVVSALVIGGLMALIYGKDEKRRRAQFLAAGADDPAAGTDFDLPELERRHPLRSWFVTAALLAMVIMGAKGIPWAVRVPALALCAAALVWALARWFEPAEVRSWLRESLALMKVTLPVLIPAILVIAFVARRVPLEWFTLRADGSHPAFYLGDNSLRSTFLASLFGSVMYFPILTEVPFVKAFLKQGMGIAPGMAVLIGGPGASFPGALILARFVGWRMMVIYETLEILLDTGIAYFFGLFYGDYHCPCMAGAERHTSLEWVTTASGLIAVAAIAAAFVAWRRQPAR